MTWSPYANLCRHCGGRMIWWAEDDLQTPWLCCESCDLPAGAFPARTSTEGEN